jgi:hypothetical protein
MELVMAVAEVGAEEAFQGMTNNNINKPRLTLVVAHGDQRHGFF